MRRPALSLLVLGATAYAFFASCSGDDTTASPQDAGGVDASFDGSTTTDSSAGGDTGADSAPPGDAAGSDAGGVDRGPTSIPYNGLPNGIFWDYGTKQALYIADERSTSVSKWTDRGGFSVAVTFPLPPADAGDPDAGDAGPPGLGQVVRLLDGTLVVTEFGFGTTGAILYTDKTGDAAVVPALSPKKRRIGLAMLPDGTLVDTYFIEGDAGPVGAIAKVALTGTEKDFVTGLGRPVGVVYNNGAIEVSDPTYGAIFRASLAAGGTLYPDGGVDDAGKPLDGGVNQLAQVESPDLLCQGPDGVLFAGGNASGNVYRVDTDGGVSTVATGLKDVRGCAYDGEHKRLFVAERDPAAGTAAIRIFPIQ